MKRKNQSKRHHYLPRLFLRGFTNSEGCFWVYDKQDDRILPRPLTPDSAFFVNHLNTINLPNGERSDFLEDLYASIERRTLASLRNIRRSTPDVAIPLWDTMNLFHFMLYLHWRLPKNVGHVEALSDSLFKRDGMLPFFRLVNKQGRDAPEELLSEIRSDPNWKKIARVVAPFAPFYEEGWGGRLRGWRYLYSGDGSNWFLVGDNPIITDGRHDDCPKRCLANCIFPVSGRILVVAADHAVPHEIAPEVVIQFGAAIIARSARFVAFHRKDFLDAIVQDYKLHRQFEAEDTIVQKLFAMVAG